MRLDQYFRYFRRNKEEDRQAGSAGRTEENTMTVDEDAFPDDEGHGDYDAGASAVAAGTRFPCAQLRIVCPGATRRQNSNLLVPYSSFLEPLGPGREKFYEKRLLFGLPWHCFTKPTFEGKPPNVESTWTFATGAPHAPEAFHTLVMKDRQIAEGRTFEEACVAFESAYVAQGLCCACCESIVGGCALCAQAVGWHVCPDEGAGQQRWRAGTLHSGKLDMDSTLWELARRHVPLDALKGKLEGYIAEGFLDAAEYDRYVELFEQMQGTLREHNVHVDPAAASASATEAENRQMSMQAPRVTSGLFVICRASRLKLLLNVKHVVACRGKCRPILP